MTVLMPNDHFVLIENSRDWSAPSFLFERPERIVRCDAPEDVERALGEIDAGLRDGLHAAGWFAYELGHLLEPRLRHLLPRRRTEPLVWFGLFRRRQRLSRADVEQVWRDLSQGRGFALAPLVPDMDREAYLSAYGRVQDYLAAGDVYQINLTMDARADFSGDPLALHAALRKAQPVGHGGFVAAGDWCVSSHSPELFIERRGDALTVRPMKGTAPRGRWAAEDEAARTALRNDPKSRAENLMIVDLERNDLSRLALPGSVRVESLFDVEAYPSVLQMVSTVTARVPPETGTLDILKRLFPCGSVTGAPKIRAMEIIAELEDRPRGVYTGAIGCIAPDGDASFSVPIRTLTLDGQGRARLGIGSGIVADSDGPAEYDECLLKAAFVTAPAEQPCLIETLLWDRGDGWWLLEGHLDRLLASARYFGYPAERDGIRAVLDEARGSFAAASDHRVRLLLGPSGAVSVTAAPVDVAAGRARLREAPPTAAWAGDAVRSDDRMLFHKATRRAAYDRALRDAKARGCWDLLFRNERGEVTEGARSTLFVRRDGEWLTPALACGLLPGVFRAHFMAEEAVREAVLHPEDVASAERVCLGNSVWGLIDVRVEGGPP
ncbi:MAG: aminodeoxychorismate synthase component I [Alphaproteobacteria bacterium]|nr:aminodeoxychorismate synthase component I [Alphaproteobacteria bacterium]